MDPTWLMLDSRALLYQEDAGESFRAGQAGPQLWFLEAYLTLLYVCKGSLRYLSSSVSSSGP